MIRTTQFLAVALFIGALSSAPASAEVKNCAAEAVGGAIIGGLLGGLLGGDNAGAGIAIGAGGGAVVGAAGCQAGGNTSVEITYGNSYEDNNDYDRDHRRPKRRPKNSYSKNQVIDKGMYMVQGRWFRNCDVVRELTCTTIGQGRRAKERCDIDATRVRCDRIGWVKGEFKRRNFRSYRN